MQGSVMTRLCDLGLGVILPFHSHVAMNAVVSDYIPYAYRSALSDHHLTAVSRQSTSVILEAVSGATCAVPVRYGLLGASGITALGLLKLNLFGPGLTDTVRSLWRHEKPAPLPKKTAKSAK